MSNRSTVTISDVARAAGVSPGTVSRVLNARGNIRISETTRQQVLDAVQRLGYRRNRFASALRSQRSGVIGAIVRDINDPFFALFAREIQNVARAEGIELLLGHAEYDLQTAERHLNIMSAWFDGVLLLGDMPGDQQIIADLKERGTAYVSVARGAAVESPCINIDDTAGVELALNYLCALGHTRIAFVGELEHVGIHERFRAFRRLAEERGLTWRDDYLRSCQNTRLEGLQAARVLLGLAEPPTAIFCATDLLAVGAITGAWQIGWRVPEAISIIGFDDIEEAGCTYPALTTVRQPVRHMATAAYNLLMSLINDSFPENGATQILVEPRLMVRQSCAPPACSAYSERS